MSAVEHAATGAPVAMREGNPRLMRFLLAAFVLAAIGVGYVARTVTLATEEVAALSDDVRADSARTVDSPPPAVTGWAPGANVPAAPEPATWSSTPAPAPAWSSESFPVARPNPYDVPGDPSASMVGIAPRAPRARAAMLRQRVFTDNDLLATRGQDLSTPPAPQPESARDADDDDSDDDD